MSGIDCATRLDAVRVACARAKGVTFVVRYFDDTFGLSPKSLSEQEAHVIINGGLELFVVYESTGGASGFDPVPAGAAYFTRHKGMEDAGFALAAARVLSGGGTTFEGPVPVGYPPGAPIFFAVDYDASVADADAITEYFNGAYQVLKDIHPMGVYGSWNVLERAVRADSPWVAVPYRWQAYAPGWSGGANAHAHPAAHIVQTLNSHDLCGFSVDSDVKQVVSGLAISGWTLAPFVTREEFDKYKVDLQHELDANYVRYGSWHELDANYVRKVTP